MVHLGLRCLGSFERLVAIKRLLHVDNPDARDMFVDEARIAGMLRHPNVVAVLDVGVDADGPFLVMDYIDGISLATLIRNARDVLPLALVLRCIEQASMGLAAAHNLRDLNGNPQGLIHRDISPQNILLGFDGVVRLTDFGVAKASGNQSHTATGILKGKLGYMAPEMLAFRPAEQASDIFAMGVVLYELLSGRRLYRNAETRLTAHQILHDPVPDIRAHRPVPEVLRELCCDTLAKDPMDRPSALELAERTRLIAAKLAEQEGPFHIGPYLKEHLGHLQKEKQRTIVALRKAWARKHRRASPCQKARTALVLETPTASLRPEHRRLGGLLLASAAALGVSLVAFVDERPTEATPEQITVEKAPLPEPPAPVLPLVPSPEAAAIAPAAVEESAPPEAEPAPEQRQGRSRAPRNQARPRSTVARRSPMQPRRRNTGSQNNRDNEFSALRLIRRRRTP